MNELERKLRNEFLECLKANPCGDVVDDLIKVIKKDYVLLSRKPLSCRNCFNYNRVNGWPSDYCKYHGKYIPNCDCAYNCKDFLSGEEAARESIAIMKSELTGEWII